MNLFSGLKAAPVQETISGSDSELKIESDYFLKAGDDEKFMSRAITLARKGIYTTHPNPAVGCVIVKDGEVVGEGWHRFAGQDHAEVIALQDADDRAKGATMYVTLEPCSHQGRTPPCVKPIIKSGISRVVVATEDPNPQVNRGGISELQQAGIDVLVGPCNAEAKYLNRGFFKRITTGLPWVTLKVATSLDGNTAMENGESQWITSEPARQDAHRLRASASAIMTGIGTVLRDNPKMTARVDNVVRQPLRVVLDTNLSVPSDANILTEQGNALIFTAESSMESNEFPIPESVEVTAGQVSAGRINLREVLEELGRREVNSVLLEAGAQLNGGMLSHGLVDEIVLYMSPDLLGSFTKGMIEIPGMESIDDKICLEFREVAHVGRDLRLTLDVLSN